MPSVIVNLGTRRVWSPSHPDRFNPEQGVPSTQRIGGWRGATAGLDTGEGTKSLASARNPTTIPQSSNPQQSRLRYSSPPFPCTKIIVNCLRLLTDFKQTNKQTNKAIFATHVHYSRNHKERSKYTPRTMLAIPHHNSNANHEVTNSE